MSWHAGSTAQYTADMNTGLNNAFFSANEQYLPISTHPGKHCWLIISQCGQGTCMIT